MNTNHLVVLFSFVILGSSCVSYAEMVNFGEAPGIPKQPQAISNYRELKIQPKDVLAIQINSLDAAAVQPFMIAQGSDEQGAGGNHIVDSKGEINFPTLGKIYLKDLNLEAAADTILQLLEPYFEQAPIVRVELVNFRVNVTGEVSSPGLYLVPNERVTILDALSLAGDLTEYAKRDSILIVREEEGMRTFGYIDLSSSNAFSSPYFYLQQNDLVYVKPNKNITNTVRDPISRVLPWVSAAASLTAVIIAFIRLR